MPIVGARISQLDPIPSEWSEERLIQFMNDGLVPVSDETRHTYKAALGVILSYATGKSVTKESIAYDYDPTQSYPKDSLRLYQNELYISNDFVPSGSWNSSKWNKIPLSVLVDKTALMISLKHNSSTTYNTNDFCTNGYVLYKCKADNVTGAWDVSKWDETNIATELKNVLDYVASKNKLSDFNDDITKTTFIYNNNNPISGSGVYNFGSLVISAEYNPSSTYNTRYLCFHEGILYESLEDNVTGEWNASKWRSTDIASSLVSLISFINEGIKESDLGNIIAEVYDPTHTYKYPKTCIHEKILYRCDSLTDITGTWDSSKWTAIKSMDVFSGNAPGLVPSATPADADKVLKGDGTWGEAASSVVVSYDSQNEELHLDFSGNNQ